MSGATQHARDYYRNFPAGAVQKVCRTSSNKKMIVKSILSRFRGFLAPEPGEVIFGETAMAIDSTRQDRP